MLASSISTRKRKFLELKQRNRSIAKYEREFLQLSKYACNIVSNEEQMCIRFENGLNDEICMSLVVLKLREFIKLSE